MTETVNYGLIGAGMMGREHLRNIALLEGTRIAALYEPDDAMAARAGALAPEAQRMGSVAALLDMPALDCLVIASPNFCHAGQLREIAARRALPILVEKPLFTDPGDRRVIADLRASYPEPIWVAMEYRYMPPIAALIAEAEAATGGIRMLTIREHRFPFLEKVGDWNRFNRNTGGTLVEKCCHFFDLMRLILKAEPRRIMASAGQAVNHLDERYGGEVPDILDHGYVIVDFDSGARAMLELCMFAEGAEYQEVISAIGPHGKIEAQVPGPGRFWPAHLGAPPDPRLILSPRAPQGPKVQAIPVDPALLAAGDHNGATYYQHQRFLDLVRAGQGRVEVTLADGEAAVLMGMAAQISAAEGRVVEMAELRAL
ncbi:MAG: Gfo/Idh/MocA family oxidoreductase [Rhodobacteraceae bacterium]|nr:MAG: Gfo/Idh/MocA family oxidoreductase [Paracoccaceae bacterium]